MRTWSRLALAVLLATALTATARAGLYEGLPADHVVYTRYYDSSVTVSPDGTTLVFYSYRLATGQLFAMDPDGSNQRQLLESDAHDWFPSYSPDGRRILFATDRDGEGRFEHGALYVLDLDDGETQPLVSDPDAWILGGSWSPDGRKVVHSTNDRGPGDLRIVDVATGEARLLTRSDDHADGHASWSPDGRTIVFRRKAGEETQLVSIDVRSGAETVLLAQSTALFGPCHSRDGRFLAFTREVPGTPGMDVYLCRLDGSDMRRVTTHPGMDMVSDWSPDGDRLYFKTYRFGAGELMSIRVDGSDERNLTRTSLHHDRDAVPSPTRQEVAFVSRRRGGARLALYDGHEIRWIGSARAEDAHPSFAPDGNHLVFRRSEGGNADLFVVDRNGHHLRRLTDDPAAEENPAWSPDGRRIAFDSDHSGSADVMVMDADGGDLRVVAGGEHDDSNPAWTPDGRSLAFNSDREGNYRIYFVVLDGGDPRAITDGDLQAALPAYSPDGRRIAHVRASDRNWQVWTMAADGSDPVALTALPVSHWAPRYSPDGRRILFESDRDGDWALYSMRTDGTDVRRLVPVPERSTL